MTYRGGYKMFHKAVEELAARGIFDPTEVTDYDKSTGKSKCLEVGADDSFISLFPTHGRFKGCQADRLEGSGLGNFYTVSYSADNGQYIEKIQFETSRELPETFIVALDMKDCTYEFYTEGDKKASFQLKLKRSGKFRRPDRADELAAAEERREARKARDPGEHTSNRDCGRTVLNPTPQDIEPTELPDNPNPEYGRDAPVDGDCGASGRGRPCDVRLGNKWNTGFRKLQVSDGEPGDVSRREGDMPRPQRPKFRVSVKFSK